MITSTDIAARSSLLHGLLARRLAPKKLVWLNDSLAKITAGSRPSDLTVAIGLAPRKLGKSDLDPDVNDIRVARSIRPGLDVSGWSTDQTARILFMLASWTGDETAFAERLDAIFQCGEIGEQIALLRGLPLYPAPQRLVERAAEGVRSVMLPVFEAVAHCNPFPQEEFSQAQWNQMVVKAQFIGSTLGPIQGLDGRRNADLAVTLMDYVHERWAAGRPVSPELWRCVGPFARGEDIADMAKVLKDGSVGEVAAAALALSECPRPEANAVLRTVPAMLAGISSGQVTWSSISQK